jgi:hypothetical protein
MNITARSRRTRCAVGYRREDQRMTVHKAGAVLVAVVIAMAAGTGTAGADPTPSPAPPYVIQTPGGPAVGGLRTLPPRCAVQPRACAGNWNPDTGAWDFPPGT